MKVAVVVFPGSNCHQDCLKAVAQVGTATELWHTETAIGKVDLIILPGGFSWGDYLRAGAVAARAPIMAEVIKSAKRGVAVLGICNGFQLLTEAGLLSGALIQNRQLDFICHQTQLKVESTASLFTKGYQQGEVVEFPIAHQEGQYFCDEETFKRLEGEGQIAFSYCHNPNGSKGDIAGITSPNGRVLGLMPHPERAMLPEGENGCDGIGFFAQLAQSLTTASTAKRGAA